MKEGKFRFITQFFNWLDKKYKAPEDCKLFLAEQNLNTMIPAQIPLISLGFFGLIFLLINSRDNYLAVIPRFIYFGIYIVFGILCIYLSLKLKKVTFTSSRIKMIPTYILFTYLMLFPMYTFFYEKNIMNTLVVFACITVNFPVFFNIEPAIYCTFVTFESVLLLDTIWRWRHLRGQGLTSLKQWGARQLHCCGRR